MPYTQWQTEGKKGALEKAKERMDKILNTHTPVPLSDEQEKEIRHILDKARKYYKEKDLL